MSPSGRWSDLAPRVLSGLAMAVLGIGAVWAGGWVFDGLICAVAGLMIWEAARMFQSAGAVPLGVAGAVGLAVALVAPDAVLIGLFAAMAGAAALLAGRDRALLAVFAVWIMLGSYATVHLRGEAGAGWLVWLVLVVVVSDVAGYFAGRMIGGPKFWPRVSPKKTWSGTVAGWAGAGAIGWAFAAPLAAGAGLILASVLVGFAGQMGDIAESAVKRRTGIKDSSDLIPGHGGVLDRFDAMLGAAVMVMLLQAAGLMPGLS